MDVALDDGVAVYVDGRFAFLVLGIGGRVLYGVVGDIPGQLSAASAAGFLGAAIDDDPGIGDPVDLIVGDLLRVGFLGVAAVDGDGEIAVAAGIMAAGIGQSIVGNSSAVGSEIYADAVSLAAGQGVACDVPGRGVLLQTDAVVA